MRSAVIFWALLLVGCVAPAQDNSMGSSAEGSNLSRGNGSFYYSLSRQFTIHRPERGGPPPITSRLTADGPELVRLEPTLLAVSCERIKHELLHELGDANDHWRGAIRVELHPARGRNDTIQIASSYYPNGWLYRMDLPDAIEPSRLIDAVVQVLLLEMANRTSSGRCAEIPLWLACGLSQQLTRNAVVDLVLRPPNKRDGSSPDGVTSKTDRSWEAVDTTSERAHKVAAGWGVRVFDSVADAAAAGQSSSVVMANPLARAHEELREQAPLTWEQLSWPEDNVLLGPAAGNYRNSSQLLLCDLARLPDGRVCLRDFIGELSQHYNWQMAFLKAFHSHFENPRDLEKWWALKVESFTQRDLTQTWPDDESWRKVEEVIRPRALVRTAGDNTPMRAEMSLQNVIQDVTVVAQTPILQEKVAQLMLLRMRVSQKFVALVDSYRQALETYFQKRQKLPVAKLSAGVVNPKLDRINAETIRALNALDARFDGMHPKEETPVGGRNDTAVVLPGR